MKTTAATLLLALAGCSGAASDSPSLNVADRDFITDSVAHLSVDLETAQDASDSVDSSQAQVVRAFVRLTESELDAFSELAERDGIDVPGAAESLDHVDDVDQHSPPRSAGRTVLEQLTESNAAALDRAQSHLDRGRHPELRRLAERMTEDRKKLRSSLDAREGADE